jgi:hypothetical protein
VAKLVELNLHPDARTLRQFGFIALFGFSLLALMAFREAGPFRFGLGDARMVTTWTLLGVGALCSLFSLAYPKANLPLYVGLSVLFFPLGMVVSHILLAALFFAVIGPISLLVRVSTKDPMRRSYDSAAPSYWNDVEGPRPKDSYFRQF